MDPSDSIGLASEASRRRQMGLGPQQKAAPSWIDGIARFIRRSSTKFPENTRSRRGIDVDSLATRETQMRSTFQEDSSLWLTDNSHEVSHEVSLENHLRRIGLAALEKPAQYSRRSSNVLPGALSTITLLDL
ncbi:hypothetical protein CFAM422_007659 [Trichoderma lentiforme]|uniref:Uncharacterized protein n=1 Tax=Trichoderma lentiforme TaxID=1567552 RepID=A0A9P4XAW2_9HYPO|nr:hypothetical protein CFAM422_007659 [Trichoderma lentiforme]